MPACAARVGGARGESKRRPQERAPLDSWPLSFPCRCESTKLAAGFVRLTVTASPVGGSVCRCAESPLYIPHFTITILVINPPKMVIKERTRYQKGRVDTRFLMLAQVLLSREPRVCGPRAGNGVMFGCGSPLDFGRAVCVRRPSKRTVAPDIMVLGIGVGGSSMN